MLVVALHIFPLLSHALDRSQWKWTQDLPREVITGTPAKNRTPSAVDTFFNHGVPRRSVDEIVAMLGQPDAFSPVIPPKGGVLRFSLQDGGSVEVHTPDFHTVFEAFRFSKDGKVTLLEKQAIRLTRRCSQPLAGVLKG
jgi:hypothetical protein